MDLEREIVRLKRTVSSLCALAWCGVIVLIVWQVLTRTVGSYWLLSVTRKGDAVRLSTVSDGPFIVTHLTVRGQDVDSEGDKRVAALDPPLAIIDSEGGDIPDIRKLKWTDIRGGPAEPPGADTPLTALYFRPSYAEPRKP